MFGGSLLERSSPAGGGEKYDWKQPNRLLVVQTGEKVEQAKVFKAPQGLCENLFDRCDEIAGEPARRWRWALCRIL